MPDLDQMGNMISMFNNPLFMNMVTQLVSDPEVQRVMSNLVNNMFNPNAGASGALEVENPNASILATNGQWFR
jgi:hypothetical protein